MYGRCPRLPIDITLGIPTKTDSVRPYAAYADNLKERLAHAYDLASQGSVRKAASNKRRYDVRTQDATLLPGDRVLARNLSNRGKHKLQDRWEDVPYIVLRRAGNLPVYVVQQEGGDKRRTLHRNLLLPYSLPAKQHQTKQRHTHPCRGVNQSYPTPTSDSEDDNRLEEEDPVYYLLREEANDDAEICEHREIEIQPPTEAQPEGAEQETDNIVFESHDDQQREADVPHREIPTITRSGRLSKPPSRLGHDPIWTQKTSVLLSLVTPTNYDLIKGVLENWWSTSYRTS